MKHYIWWKQGICIHCVYVEIISCGRLQSDSFDNPILKVKTMSDIKDEVDALLQRIRSPNTRKAGDDFFSADPLDLSSSYSPDNFVRQDSRPDLTLTDTSCKKS